MGYITYPRTSGSAKDIKRAEHVLLLIERLLQYFNPSDLTFLLTLVSRIGWDNLPPALRHRLLQLLYYDLFEKVKAQSKTDRGAVVSLVQPTTKMLVDIALQQSALSDTIALADLPLHERINKKTQISVSRKLVTHTSGYEDELLVFDNGIHAILNACASRERYLKDQQKQLRLAIRAYDADTSQMLQQAHKSGMLVTVNLLFDYIIEQNIQNNNSHDNHIVRSVSYNLQQIEKGMLLHTVVRKVVLDAIEGNLGLSKSQSTISSLGYKRAYSVLQSYLIARLDPEYIVLSNSACNFNFWVEDSQTQGTECRFLTIQLVNIARQFEAQGRKATLLEWLEKIEAALVCFFKVVRIKRHAVQQPRHYHLREAELMAAAIRQELQQYLNYLSIPMSLTLNNQLASYGVSAQLPDLDSTENSYVEF